MNKHSAMNIKGMLKIKQYEQNTEWKNWLQCLQQKSKNSTWKMLNNEKEEVQNEASS